MITRSFHAAKALLSAVRIVRDPNRLNEVFSLSDHMVMAATDERRQKMIAMVRRDPVAASALADKPRVGKIDLRELKKLPGGTLGHEFAEHMLANGLSPDALPVLTGSDELEFLRGHLYETHDIWHVVTGFGTDVAGELGLQAFYLAQFPGGLPSALLAGGFVNTVLYAFEERDERMRAIVRGWLLGKRAKPFFGVRWAELWQAPLVEVRARLGVVIGEVEKILPASSAVPGVLPRAA
jgi:ubiquinone biosynthesis protein COQ4